MPADAPAAPTRQAVADPKPAGSEDGRRARSTGTWLAVAWLSLFVGAAVLAPVLPLADPNRSFDGLARAGPFPVDGHLLGGDAIGRDLLSRTVHGARASLLVGAGAMGIAVAIGGGLGLAAGYLRGPVDAAVRWLFDVMLSFPGLLLALALMAFLQGDPTQPAGSGDRPLPLPDLSAVQIMIVSLGAVAVPTLGRITRAAALSWSQREFIVAARVLGATHGRIMRRELLPNIWPAILSIALLGMAVAIIAEGALSLLGVGMQPPQPSWGAMIAEGRNRLRSAPHLMYVPMAAVFVTILSLNQLAAAVRRRTDVRESNL